MWIFETRPEGVNIERFFQGFRLFEVISNCTLEQLREMTIVSDLTGGAASEYQKGCV